MQDARMQRLLGVGGLVFVALLVVSIAAGPMWSSHIDPAKLVADVHKHKSGLKLSALFVGLAVLEGLAFFWYLREYLCTVEANRRLATLAFAAVILFAASGCLSGGFHLAMADAVDHYDPNVLATLNLLANDVNTIFGFAGTILLLLADGIAVIRNGPLPTWIGWAGVVLAVVSILLGPIPVGIWLVIVCITMLVRSGQAGPAPAAA